MKEREKYDWMRVSSTLFTTIDTIQDYIEFFKKNNYNEELIKPLYSFMQILTYDLKETITKTMEDLKNET